MSTISENDSQVLVVFINSNGTCRKCVMSNNNVRFKSQKEFRDFVVMCYDKLDLYIGTSIQNMKQHCPEWFEYTEWFRTIDTVNCFSSKFQESTSWERILFLNTKLEIQD